MPHNVFNILFILSFEVLERHLVRYYGKIRWIMRRCWEKNTQDQGRVRNTGAKLQKLDTQELPAHNFLISPAIFDQVYEKLRYKLVAVNARFREP